MKIHAYDATKNILYRCRL